MGKNIYWQTINFKGSRDAQAALVARHFEARFGLGLGLVISEHVPELTESLTRYWSRIARELQTQRDATADADEKLILTNKIIRLQSVQIRNHSSEAGLMVIKPEGLSSRGGNKSPRTIYLLDTPNDKTLKQYLLSQSVPMLLVGTQLPEAIAKLTSPKSLLDKQVIVAWEDLTNFIKSRGIDLAKLAHPNPERSEHIDETLEYLLDEHVATEFLQLYATFRNRARKAAPLEWTHLVDRQQQTVAVLARQVHSFASPVIGQQFDLDNDDPSFFLNDPMVNWLNSLLNFSYRPTVALTCS